MIDSKEKVLLFDFDGTLHDYGVVLPETYEALEYARKKGCKLYVNTGRTRSGLLKDLNNIIKFDFDGLLCGGSCCYVGKNYQTTVFEQPELSDEVMLKSLRFIRDKSYWAVIEGNDHLYTIEQHGEIAYSEQEREEFYQKAVAAYRATKPFKIAIWVPRHLVDTEIPSALPEFDWVFYPNSNCYEGFYKGCGKFYVIKKLSEVLGIPTDNFISFGDSENDISAFKATGKSVAMQCANDVVKKAATFVATTKAGIKEGVFHYVK